MASLNMEDQYSLTIEKIDKVVISSVNGE